MKLLAIPASLPSVLAELDRALASGGPCALDPEVAPAIWRRALAGPAADFLARRGKELRAAIVHAGWTLAGGAPHAMPQRLPLVVEILHAGSLIIDDVEDNSDERRGAPALHKLVGAPLAINTGSWMYFWALAELAELGLPDDKELALHRIAATTLVRCHQGQALDLAVRITDLAIVDVTAVVATTTRLKTAALCELAAVLGALAAGAPPAVHGAIARFGAAIGTALQMLDDLGSITAPSRRAKGREDLVARRPTWPWAWLVETDPFAWSRLVARLRTSDAIDEIADELALAVEPVGRARIRLAIESALGELADALGDHPAARASIEALAIELARMEESYG